MTAKNKYAFRPLARLPVTIGADLIQDPIAAIVELIKNAYDADASKVDIRFFNREGKAVVTISDDGHGMTRETVLGCWMVPATGNKLNRKSPKGRILQGRKGVGRYAVGILGDILMLDTVSQYGSNREKTSLSIDWRIFDQAHYLDEVLIDVATVRSDEPVGTKLTVFLNHQNEALFKAERKQDYLISELRKLISPFHKTNDSFVISVCFGDKETKIEPYPILEAYHYRISGIVNKNGEAKLTFYNQRLGEEVQPQEIKDKFPETGCGNLKFDLRVYDREKNALEEIAKVLAGKNQEKLKNAEIRNLLNAFNGVGVYRNGFRIRPLGDADFDWLELNKKRVQDPTFCIGSNQIIGIVDIESEEQSGLIEKSARDGLKENEAFDGLKNTSGNVIQKLEERRFSYRKMKGLESKKEKSSIQLHRLGTLDDLKTKMDKLLLKLKLSSENIENVHKIISQEEEQKAQDAKALGELIAVYQGQATLGKIMTVVLHEGRSPLNSMEVRYPELLQLFEQVKKQPEEKVLEAFVECAGVYPQAAETLTTLFGKLNPLALTNRNAKRELVLRDLIKETSEIFKNTLKEHSIDLRIIGGEGFKFPVWRQDVSAIFSNLIDNSIFWISQSKKITKKEIVIQIYLDNGNLQKIEYRDSGPGISPENIESEMIFEPGYSLKYVNGEKGSGLGLAIAGEAAQRQGWKLEARESQTGAYFVLNNQKGEIKG